MIRYVLAIFMSLWVSSALAQDCTKTHVVGSNETIFDIAQRYLGDPQKWSVIYYANQGKLNGALLQFAPGTFPVCPAYRLRIKHRYCKTMPK
jgi:polar amino acid transport system substrate-binding protein